MNRIPCRRLKIRDARLTGSFVGRGFSTHRLTTADQRSNSPCDADLRSAFDGAIIRACDKAGILIQNISDKIFMIAEFALQREDSSVQLTSPQTKQFVFADTGHQN